MGSSVSRASSSRGGLGGKALICWAATTALISIRRSVRQRNVFARENAMTDSAVVRVGLAVSIGVALHLLLRPFASPAIAANVPIVIGAAAASLFGLNRKDRPISATPWQRLAAATVAGVVVLLVIRLVPPILGMTGAAIRRP
jgi:hypothetical protein